MRVRNVATVGGNLAHADPHLDLPPVWVVLDATAPIGKSRGERIVPVEDIFAGYYETTICATTKSSPRSKFLGQAGVRVM